MEEQASPGALLGADSLERLSIMGGDNDGVGLARLHGAILLLGVLDGDLGLAIRDQHAGWR